MRDRCVPDHLSQLFTTLTGEKKHCDTVTDDLLKKRTEKGKRRRRCKKLHLHHHMYVASGHNNGEFHCHICHIYGLSPAGQGKKRDRSIWYRSVTVMKEKSEKWMTQIERLGMISG